MFLGTRASTGIRTVSSSGGHSGVTNLAGEMDSYTASLGVAMIFDHSGLAAQATCVARAHANHWFMAPAAGNLLTREIVAKEEPERCR